MPHRSAEYRTAGTIGKQRWFFWLMLCFISIYISFVFVIRELLELRLDGTVLGKNSLYIASSSIIAILLAGSILLFLCKKAPTIHIRIKKEKLHWQSFFVVFVLCLAFYCCVFLDNYPGGYSVDTNRQWVQIQNFQFNDWHPVFHTLLLWLITRISNHYTFILLFQCIAFSAGIAYLYTSMYAWGYPKLVLIPVILLICTGENTQAIMMYAWKDTAMTILVLFVFCQVVNIYHSNGEWLRKWSNAAAFSILLACVTLVRHNAVLFTLPLLLLVVIRYYKVTRRVLLCALLSMLLVFAIKVPLYNALDVERPNNTYQEAVGIPMTILSNAYAYQSELVPDSVYAFMQQIDTPENLQQSFGFFYYNRIKFAYKTSVYVTAIEPADLISLTYQTIRAMPLFSFLAVAELTDMVWDYKDDNEGISVSCTGGDNPDADYAAAIQSIQFPGKLLSVLNSVLCNKISNVVQSRLGVLIILMLVAWLVSFSRTGFQSLLMIIPVLSYNFCTMLLLCGNDYRFFHFNCILALPIVLILLAQQSQDSPKLN